MIPANAFGKEYSGGVKRRIDTSFLRIFGEVGSLIQG